MNFLIGYWLCLRQSTETRATSVLYLSPPITLLWAWAMLDEPLSWQMGAGMAISAIGIWLVMHAEAWKSFDAPCDSVPTPPSDDSSGHRGAARQHIPMARDR